MRQAAFATTVVSALLLAACSRDPADVRSIEVVGEGGAVVRYDTVYLKAFVNWRSSVERVAREGAARADAAVAAALRAAGAPENELRAGKIEVYPSHPGGFVATSVIEARLADPDRAPTVVAAVIEAAERTHATLHWAQPFLEVAQPSEELAAARKDAIADARRRARDLAAAQRLTLGDVVSIVEATANPPPRVELKVWLPDQGKPPDIGAFLQRVQATRVQLVKLRVRFEAR